MSPLSAVDALAAALRSSPGRPLLTVYDEAAGQRVELSVATFDNWVCKLANLMSSDWDLSPGEVLGVSLEPGWQAVATVVAAWSAGLSVMFGAAPGAAMSLTRWEDFASEVPGQPDVLLLPAVLAGTDPALVDASRVWTHADLAGRGVAAAAQVGLEPGGRLATDLDPTSEAGVDIALLAPLMVGASLVLLVDASPERRERIADQERATCSRWTTDGQSLSSSSKS